MTSMQPSQSMVSIQPRQSMDSVIIPRKLPQELREMILGFVIEDQTIVVLSFEKNNITAFKATYSPTLKALIDDDGTRAQVQHLICDQVGLGLHRSCFRCKEVWNQATGWKRLEEMLRYFRRITLQLPLLDQNMEEPLDGINDLRYLGCPCCLPKRSNWVLNMDKAAGAEFRLSITTVPEVGADWEGFFQPKSQHLFRVVVEAAGNRNL